MITLRQNSLLKSGRQSDASAGSPMPYFSARRGSAIPQPFVPYVSYYTTGMDAVQYSTVPVLDLL